MVYGCNNDLRDTTENQASHEEDATPTDLGNNTAVHGDGNDAHGSQNAGVHEGATDIGHLVLI